MKKTWFVSSVPTLIKLYTAVQHSQLSNESFNAEIVTIIMLALEEEEEEVLEIQ